LRIICSDWPQTANLLISSSQVARSTGMSYWCLNTFFVFKSLSLFKFLTALTIPSYGHVNNFGFLFMFKNEEALFKKIKS
jgi:hypothetical protein